MATSLFEKVKEYDEARPGIPGEHWMALGAGLGVWLLSRRSPSFLMRTLGMVAGTALVGRAASGRDGIARLARYLPVGAGIPRR